jgi:hypothetical protein
MGNRYQFTFLEDPRIAGARVVVLAPAGGVFRRAQ